MHDAWPPSTTEKQTQTSTPIWPLSTSLSNSSSSSSSLSTISLSIGIAKVVTFWKIMAEEEGIGLVLARATELRSKVASCMTSVTASAVVIQNHEFGGETQHLLNICGALEALESQLSSLQVMKQNHRHERETALAEIDYSRRVLLDQLKDYKGEDMELIWEASDFAGQTVDYDTNSSYKVLQSGTRHRTTNIINEPSRNQTQRFIHLIGRAAKAAFTLVGIISLLSFANTRSSWHPIMKSVSRSRTRIRCVVKERVEVPFESFVESPTIDYGCG